jgi:hypothetical protein
VEVAKATGTVKKVDTDKRNLVVHLDDGRTKTYRVYKSVKNLNQFRPETACRYPPPKKSS